MTRQRMVSDLANLRANVRYLYARVESLRQQWHDSCGLCCPGCMFGQEWRRLEEAIIRRLRYELVLAWKGFV